MEIKDIKVQGIRIVVNGVKLMWLTTYDLDEYDNSDRTYEEKFKNYLADVKAGVIKVTSAFSRNKNTPNKSIKQETEKKIESKVIDNPELFHKDNYFMFRRLSKFKDENGKIDSNKMLEYLMPFIEDEAKSYKHKFNKLVTLDLEEYISEMIVTLLETIKEIEASENRKDFKSTYIRRCDRNIGRLVRNSCNLSFLSDKQFEDFVDVTLNDEYKDLLNCVVMEYKYMYNNVVHTEDIYDYIDDINIKNMGYNNINSYMNTKLLKDDLDYVIKSLTDREIKILRLRFGFVDNIPKTLEEIGKEFGVTKDRIRQIEAKALRKLRDPNRSCRIKNYLGDFNSGEIMNPF